MSTQPVDPWAEWKDGYRDGLAAGLAVTRTCAADPGATVLDVLTLLEALWKSKIIDTGSGDALVMVTRLHLPNTPDEPHEESPDAST